jgi:hypothetical protein
MPRKANYTDRQKLGIQNLHWFTGSQFDSNVSELLNNPLEVQSHGRISEVDAKGLKY